MTDISIILGSSSPRRQQLISKLGLKCEIVNPGFEEVLLTHLSPAEYVRHNAMQKGLWILQHSPLVGEKKLIVSADTIVVFDGHVLEKPSDFSHAENMLSNLSGNMHVVLTSVCVTLFSGKQFEHTESTNVFFRKMSTKEIHQYINTGEPMDKAGSYGIQGIGSDFVERIEGSMSNVIGLPIHALEQLIEKSLNK